MNGINDKIFKNKNMMVRIGCKIATVKIRRDYGNHWEYVEVGWVIKEKEMYSVNKSPCTELGVVRSFKDGVIVIALLNGLSIEDIPTIE